jgi:hypothetical protein
MSPSLLAFFKRPEISLILIRTLLPFDYVGSTSVATGTAVA